MVISVAPLPVGLVSHLRTGLIIVSMTAFACLSLEGGVVEHVPILTVSNPIPWCFVAMTLRGPVRLA